MNRELHIRGAKVWDGEQSVERDLFIKNRRIVDRKPNSALEVDLEGYTLFPGMVNAHDHLELNHYPRTKFREVYDNAHQWGKDVNARLDSEPFRTLRRYPLKDRLFIGGLKNLLCGATTVAHHGPKYREMYARDFPVRVLKNYGWAHSLHFDTDEEIVRSYKKTPKNHPFFIHLAEGTDEVAAGEYQQLKTLLPNMLPFETVIIHGNGLWNGDLPSDIDDVQIVWCPSTHHYLLGETYLNNTNIDTIHAPNAFALGSDSRLTANGDLLDELNFAYTLFEKNNATLLTKLVFFESAFVLFFISTQDWLKAQPTADLVAIKSTDNDAIGLCESNRSSVTCVIYNGIPRIGDAEMMAKFPHVETVACTLDGIEKRIHIDLARQVHRCTLKERGLVVDGLPKGKRFFFF